MAGKDPTIIAHGFKGMNNLPEYAAKLLDREKQISPQIILNADVTDGGVIEARRGYQLAVDLSNCHSLWAGSIMLCVADGEVYPQSLYLIDGPQAWELCEVTGPPAQVSYEEINNVVYAGNPYWKAAYDLIAGTTRSWGIALPVAPDITLVAGDLPPGSYSLTYTNVVEGRVGGNGPLVQVRWEGGQRGVRLNNLPTGAICWITHPNGDKLFLAPVTGGVVTGQSPWLKPLPSFMVQPPPGFSHFIFAFGRIWGSLGRRVYYSDPHQYEWFRPANYMPFLEDIVLLAPTTTGMYVNSTKTTWFMAGTEPDKMELRRVGNGAVPGTLTMVRVPANVAGGAAPSELYANASKQSTPVWFSQSGFVVGTHGYGNLTCLTENKANLPVRTQGAGLYRIVNGVPQVLTSMWGLPLSEGDPLEEFFERGRIFIPEPTQVVGSGGIEIT